MKVLITAEVLGRTWTGVQFYTLQLIEHLARCDAVDLTVRCRAEVADILPDNCEKRIFAGKFAAWHAARHELEGFDIIHCPTVRAPFRRAPRGVKTVMTVHDLVPLTYGHTHQWHYRMYFRHVLPRIVRRFHALVAVSAATRRDVHNHYAVADDKMHVIPEGCRFEGCPPEMSTARRERFILAVGTLEPRKNLARVVEAFLAIDDPTLKLVIAGGRGWGETRLDEMVNPHRDRIDLRGYVETDDLRDLYRRAAMLVYPSLYEGFGLPVLEAMTLGCPVVTSRVSSLPEVGGDAAVYVDPYDVEAMAETIAALMADESRRAAMARQGVERAAGFTWDACAQRTVELYRSLLEGNG